jgi:hypothetical protein
VAHRLVEAAYRSAAGEGAVVIDDDFI